MLDGFHAGHSSRVSGLKYHHMAKHCHSRFWQFFLTNKTLALQNKWAVPPSYVGVKLVLIQALDSAVQATICWGTALQHPQPGRRSEVCHQLKPSFAQNLALRKWKQNFPSQKLTFPVIQWWTYKYNVNIQYFVLPEKTPPNSNTANCSPFPTCVLCSCKVPQDLFWPPQLLQDTYGETWPLFGSATGRRSEFWSLNSSFKIYICINPD